MSSFFYLVTSEQIFAELVITREKIPILAVKTAIKAAIKTPITKSIELSSSVLIVACRTFNGPLVL